MLKVIILLLALSLNFNLFANCNFEKGECPVKPELKKFLLQKFKGMGPAPMVDPIEGLKNVSVADAIKYIGNDKFAFVDTRPADYFTGCSIKGSVNYLYGVPGTPDNTLTKEIAKGLIDKGKTLVFYCNSEKCYRSLNASIQAYAWGIPKDKILWFGKGTNGIVKETPDYKKYLNGDMCASYKE